MSLWRVKIWLLMRMANILWFIENIRRYCLLYGGLLVLVPLSVIEALAIRFVMHICKIEPRLPMSAVLAFKWMKYMGSRIPGHDRPCDEFKGYSYDEWLDNTEKWFKNLFTRW